jgi:aspartyl-tRNA(Asn)/glutamyl-tRNA(Gln) amidotransferase subunit A
MAKPDARDWYALPYDGRDYLAGLDDGVRGLRIAYSPNLGEAQVEDQVLKLVSEAVQVFRELGATVEEVGPLFGPVRDRFEKLYLAGAGNFLRSIPEEQHDLMDPRTVALGKRGLEVTLEECLKGMSERAAFGEEMQRFHQDWDLLLTPTMPTTAPSVDAIHYDRWQVVPFTYPFNVTMQPAASIPCGVAPDGLPVGLQIAGPKFAEHVILQASRAFEKACPWPWPHPVLARALAAIEGPANQ